MGTGQMAGNVDVDGGVVANSDVAPPWLRALLFTNLYTSCSSHRHLRRRFCMTCMGEALCDVCTRSHPQQHPILEVHKVSGFPSLRIDDVKKLIDVSDIHPFVINHHRVVRLHRDDHLGKKQVLKAGHCCSNCSKTLQVSNYHFCSIVCKIEAITSCGKESNLKRSLELPEENKERIDIINTVLEPLCKKTKRERRGNRSTKVVLVQIKEERKRSTTTDEVHKLPRKISDQNKNGECSIKRIRLTIRKKTDRESQEQVLPAPQQLPSAPTCRRRHRRKGIPMRAPLF